MKILHTSDWHLGQLFYGKSREREQSAFLHWLVEQVAQQDIDVVLVAGDLFDTGTPPSYARSLYNHFIVQLQQTCPNCQLILLAGNHDSVAVLNESKGLLKALNTRVIAGANPERLAEWIAENAPKNSDEKSPRIIDAPSEASFLLEPLEAVIPLNNKAGDVEAVLCAVPFLRPSDLMRSRAELSADDRQRQLQQQISEYYQNLYQAAQILYPNKPVVMTGHLTTVGASSSESVRDIYIGTLEAFPAAAFPPADYIALGHIHRPQKVAKTEHIRYCGSPYPLSFDEISREKQVLVVTLDADRFIQAEPLSVPIFQPLARINGDLDEIKRQLDQLVLIDQQKIGKEQTVWVEMSITTQDYLSDLQRRIDDMIADRPIEVLRLRRQKTQRQSLADQVPKVQLDELSPEEVFQRRLSLETLTPERAEALTACFNQVLSSQELEQNPLTSTITPEAKS